ncbi:MAG: hypothetical protein IKZ14_06205 [Muribaculaceae bacterium]|nr:hypothetical protein [Muribaculaceae bacterium]
MKKLLTLIVAVAALCSCSDNKKVEAAQSLGQQHACEILDNEITGRQLVLRLLEIRAIEHQLRQEGNHQAAAAYIESFTTFIQTNNQELASIIFDTDSISIVED